MTDGVVQPLRSSRLSLSDQAQQYLLGLIREGVYEAGEQLPSEKELATQLGISRPTLREALQSLEREGFVVRKHGVGTFVSPRNGHQLESGLERLESILELAARQGLDLKVDALEIQQEPAGRKLAEKLQVLPGTTLTTIQRVIRAERSAVAFMQDVVPTSILSPGDVGGAFNGSVLDLLRNTLGLEIAQATADIVAVNADPFLSRKLAVRRGQAVLLMEELLFDRGGMPIEFSRNYFVPDFFRFQLVRRC